MGGGGGGGGGGEGAGAYEGLMDKTTAGLSLITANMKCGALLLG